MPERPAVVRMSRAALFQTLATAGFVLALVAMIVVGEALPRLDPEVARYAQIAIVSALSALVIVLLPSSRSHAALKVVLTKHLFAHRYDYRSVWLRFTATLGGAVKRSQTLR
ncbi:MAG: hypothetical protein EOP59_15580 [Sphingomonadales bacterium]|nr:MAG: hypothetical protein EOP59_15580 [Sphingomonadales bacterium]